MRLLSLSRSAFRVYCRSFLSCPQAGAISPSHRQALLLAAAATVALQAGGQGRIQQHAALIAKSATSRMQMRGLQMNQWGSYLALAICTALAAVLALLAGGGLAASTVVTAGAPACTEGGSEGAVSAAGPARPPASPTGHPNPTHPAGTCTRPCKPGSRAGAWCVWGLQGGRRETGGGTKTPSPAWEDGLPQRP